MANDVPLGLTNYVYTESITRGWRCFEALESGQVGINSPTVDASEIPLGGVKESGLGKESGMNDGIREFCNVKTAALAL